jgi:transposase
MVKPLKYSVAFDSSKEEFYAAILLQTTENHQIIKGTRKFVNTPKGFEECRLWILKHKKEDVPVRITMEATGNYHENLAFYFHEQEFRVSVVLPNKAKKYLQSLGHKSKNDKIDAKGLAQMGAEQNLSEWQPFSESIYTLRSLTRCCEQLTEHRTQYMNQLSALAYGMYPMKEVEACLKKAIDSLEKQIAIIKKRIEELVCADKKIWQRVENILPIKGVGILTVATVIAETNGFELFENERQLCSYAGYDVIEDQSGTRTGKTRISKKGNHHIRRILHMPALNVVKYKEKNFVEIYERIMSRNTKKMIAYAAIQRKLLCLIYALWKKNEMYNPDFVKTVK